VAEIENLKVLTDLMSAKKLASHHYGVVHYDSQDERGIDVALLYQKEHFELLDSEVFPLVFLEEDGEKDYSRDILLVKGKLKGVLTYFIVNHWPSRRKGTLETEPKRLQAAALARQVVAKINEETLNANIIILGDFNDNPTNASIKQHLVQDDFYNPFESLHDKGKGTSTHEDQWYLFDQIILSNNFFNASNAFVFRQAEIFEEHFLKSWKGKRKGNPFRTYIGKWHQGGFSDHFPVYITLAKEKAPS
jgi:predicted extracellular nuclease